MEKTNNSTAERKVFIKRIMDALGNRFRLQTRIEIGFTVALFLYYWLVTHTEYIYFARQPVFFLEKNFFLAQLQTPGGLLDYLAAFFTEMFQFGVAGSVLLTIFALVFYLLLKLILRPGTWWIGPLIPAIILAAVQTNPNYNVVQSLSFILAFAAFLFRRDVLHGKKWISIVAMILLMIALYLLSPNSLIVFTVLEILWEGFNKTGDILNRIVFSVAAVVMALLIPLFSQWELFLISIPDAFFRHSALWVSDVSGVPPFGRIYFGVLLTLSVFVAAGIFFYGIERQKKAKLKRTLIEAGAAIVVAVASLAMVVGKGEREFLAIRYAAHSSEWDKVLSYLNSNTDSDILNVFNFARAYCHTGDINDEFFMLRQNAATQNVFLRSDICYDYPLDYSDFLFELGDINQSKHFAFEALTHYGEFADVLKRLALTNIIESNFVAAKEFLYRLRENPFSSSWADHYLQCIEDLSKLRDEADLQRLHAEMSKADYITDDNRPENDFRVMLMEFPHNEMAYRFLLMHDLLTREVNIFTNDFLQFRVNEKGPIPRLYEEALTTFLSSNPSMDSVAARMGISQETRDRFKAFYRSMAEQHNDAASAYEDLKRSYGDTYWFYLLRERIGIQ